MGIAPPRTAQTTTTDTEGLLDWPGLLRVAAVLTVVLLGLAALLLRDVEAAVFTAATAVGLGLLHIRRGLAGQILLTPLFANVLFWMGLGAASHIRDGAGFVAQLFPAALTASTLTGLMAAVGALVTRRRETPSGRPRPGWPSVDRRC